jgi:hypothetical protein
MSEDFSRDWLDALTKYMKKKKKRIVKVYINPILVSALLLIFMQTHYTIKLLPTHMLLIPRKLLNGKTMC